MSTSWESVVATMASRRSFDSNAIRAMIEVRDRYNGDLVTPLIDVSGEPSMKPPIPQVVANAIDNLSMRAGSTKPIIICPALDESKETERGSVDWANRRRRALYSTWHTEALIDVKLRRAYRHYHGYGTFSLVVMPDFGDSRREPGPTIQLRDPLSSYPELRSPDDVREPLNIGFVFGRSATWIARTYPEAEHLLGDAGVDTDANRLWDLVEWIDGDDIVVGILGPRWDNSTRTDASPSNSSMELRRWPNRAGMVPVAVPRRVTLDRVMGQVWTAIGMQDLLGRLTALDIEAAERAIFPDMVVMGENNQAPVLVSGKWKDGREGEPNLVMNGKVQYLQSAPGPLTHPVLDRMERATAMSAGNSPFFAGENTGSLRTGRAIDALGGYSIDPRIQESQDVMQRALEVVNEAVLRTYKGYWPDRKFTLFSGWPSDTGQVTFTPGRHFETTQNVVAYSFPGSDVSQINVAVNQLTASRLMSRHTARVRHPYIDDADSEHRRIVTETIEDAVFQGFLQQSGAGAIPLVDAVRVLSLVQEGKPVYEAIAMAQREAQERQAAEPPPPGPGQAVAPETQAGLALPGQGAETALSRQPEAPQPLQDVHQLLNALGGGRRGPA